MKKIKSIATHILDGNYDFQSMYEERNEDDLVTLRISYTPEGEVEQKDIFEYNEKKQLVKYTQYYGDEISQTIDSSFDEKGNLSSQTIQYADGKTSTIKYEDDPAENSETKLFYNETNETEGKEYRVFDKEGNIIEEIIYDETGAIESHQKVDFDDYHNPLKLYTREPSGVEFTQFFFYDRDDKGYLDNVIVKDKDSKVLRREDYETDDKGNRTYHEINNYYEGWGRIYEMEYNDQDKLIKYGAFDANEAPLSETTYQYDGDGNLTQEETITKAGKITKKIAYEFWT